MAIPFLIIISFIRMVAILVPVAKRAAAEQRSAIIGLVEVVAKFLGR